MPGEVESRQPSRQTDRTRLTLEERDDDHDRPGKVESRQPSRQTDRARLTLEEGDDDLDTPGEAESRQPSRQTGRARYTLEEGGEKDYKPGEGEPEQADRARDGDGGGEERRLLSRLADEAGVDIDQPRLFRPTPILLPDGRYLVEGTLAGSDLSWSGDWGGQHAMLMFKRGVEEAKRLKKAIAVMDGEETDSAEDGKIGVDDVPEYEPDYLDIVDDGYELEAEVGKEPETPKAPKTDEEKWWEEDDVDGDTCEATIDVNLSGDDSDRIRLCPRHG